MNKYVGFDIEIYKEVDQVEDWKDEMPLGITCASLVTNDGHKMTFCASDEDGIPLERPMNIEEVDGLLNHIDWFQDKGYTPVSWNGFAFDFAVLHDECSDPCKPLAKKLNMSHVDMMWHFFCMKGYRVGLDAVSKGLGFGGKTEGMSGAMAPKMWKQSPLDRLKVLNYVDKDAILTVEIALATEEQGYFEWTARSGKLNIFRFLQEDRWLTVEEAWRLPKPNTSWMDKPIKREEFAWWL
jgi:hypothetical protein